MIKVHCFYNLEQQETANNNAANEGSTIHYCNLFVLTFKLTSFRFHADESRKGQSSPQSLCFPCLGEHGFWEQDCKKDEIAESYFFHIASALLFYCKLYFSSISILNISNPAQNNIIYSKSVLLVLVP